ncbi:MAG: hypothetical protein AAFX56_10645 [Pseudomonadota bacterium]
MAVLLGGCSVPQVYLGAVSDCAGTPIQGSKVSAFKNQWIPLHLPIELATTTTAADGSFALSTEKRASFFSYDGEAISFSSHPRKSKSNCE